MNQFCVIYLLKMEKSLPSVSDGLPRISTTCSSVAFSPLRSCTWAITIKMHPQFAEQRYDFHSGSSWILIYILNSDFPVMMPWFSWTTEMWDFKKQSTVGNLNPWKNIKGSLFTANGNSTSHSRTLQHPAVSPDIRTAQLSVSQWHRPFTSILPLRLPLFLLHCPGWMFPPIPPTPRNSPGKAPGEGMLSSGRIHFFARRYPCNLYPCFPGKAKE